MTEEKPQDRDIFEHVEWLVREKRHTTSSDWRTNYALSKGWAIKVDGIMSDQNMFRIILTEKGEKAFNGENE